MRTFSTLRLLLILLLSLMILSCKNKESSSEPPDDGLIAKSNSEYMAMLNDPDADIIRNHADLLEYIRSDNVLNEHLKDELLISFMQGVQFNKRGLMTYSIGDLKSRFPDKIELINNKLARGFGFDIGALAEDYPDKKCVTPATCTNSTSDVCIGDNCTTNIEMDRLITIQDILRSQVSYIRNNHDDNFVFQAEGKENLPLRATSRWFREHFRIEAQFRDENVGNWLRQNIENNRIIIYGTELVGDGEAVKIANLVFTKGLDVPEFFGDAPGLLLDSSKLAGNCVLCLFGAKPPCLCWWIYCCAGTSSECIECNTNTEIDFSELIRPGLWSEDLEILSQMPLESVLPESKVLLLSP